MREDEILNDLLSTPYGDLSALELDIRLLNEFEFSALIGGGNHYFDSHAADNIGKFVESCERHSFAEFPVWVERAEDMNPKLVSADRDTRCQGLVELGEADSDELNEEGSRLAETAGTLCLELVEKHRSQLEGSVLARRQPPASG